MFFYLSAPSLNGPTVSCVRPSPHRRRLKRKLSRHLIVFLSVMTFDLQVEQNLKARDCLLPMGVTSENVAERYGISRADQDEMAVRDSSAIACLRVCVTWSLMVWNGIMSNFFLHCLRLFAASHLR